VARSRGSFGTATRSIIDHERTLRHAAVILEGEHGSRHLPGDRRDLCPKCKAVPDDGTDAPSPRTPYDE
jgi:hypothetical protein